MAAQPKPLPVHQPNYLEGGGIFGWLTTIDHKRVAVMYLATALFFMAFGGLEAMPIRVQLWRPDNHLLSAATYNADLHDARHDDDLPGRHAAAARLFRQFSDPAADRRARRRVPAAQCAELLDFPVRRDLAEPRLASRRSCPMADGSATRT